MVHWPYRGRMDTPVTPVAQRSLADGEAPAPAPVRPYGTDTARVIEDYPDFRIFAFPGGGDIGARASVDGRLVGDLIAGVDLDELADKLDRCRRRLAGM
jgi:hypothetical protein